MRGRQKMVVLTGNDPGTIGNATLNERVTWVIRGVGGLVRNGHWTSHHFVYLHDEKSSYIPQPIAQLLRHPFHPSAQCPLIA